MVVKGLREAVSQARHTSSWAGYLRISKGNNVLNTRRNRKYVAPHLSSPVRNMPSSNLRTLIVALLEFYSDFPCVVSTTEYALRGNSVCVLHLASSRIFFVPYVSPSSLCDVHLSEFAPASRLPPNYILICLASYQVPGICIPLRFLRIFLTTSTSGYALRLFPLRTPLASCYPPSFTYAVPMSVFFLRNISLSDLYSRFFPLHISSECCVYHTSTYSTSE